MVSCRPVRMPLLRPALGRAIAVLLLVAAQTATGQEPKGPYGTAVIRHIMVPMRDGVRLATDVYLPTENDAPVTHPLPTIMMRTPYGKGDGSSGPGLYYTSHGYAVVIQDTRGRHGSEGVWHLLTDDGHDGYDAAQWVGEQPWSNQKIGTIGGSYPGGTQHAMAMAKAPYLETVIPVDAMSNLGYWSIRNNGAFELRFWNWIHLNAARGSRQSRRPEVAARLSELLQNREYYLRHLPLRPGTTPLRLAPEYEAWLVEAMGHGVNDEFWEQNNIQDHSDRYKDIPVYLVGGWYDSYGLNTTENFVTLSRAITGPVYLIMGPWIHGRQHQYAHGQVTFGPEAAIKRPLTWRREWYDHWLKGIDNKVGKEDPFKTRVRIFVMGTGDERKDAEGKKNHGGYWRNETEWPLARTQYTSYYLQPGGGLATTPPATDSASSSFEFDPRHPVPTLGGNLSGGASSNYYGGPFATQGAWDQRGGEHVWLGNEPIPFSARNDILVFQTPPLEQDMELTGDFTIRLWASSSAVDTDFTAKLIDVHPPNPDYPAGFDQNIADGIIRGRFRNGLTAEEFMEPGQVYEFTFRTYPASNVFKRGHRIRVDISSSNFPRFDVNPNTGEPLNQHRRMQTAINTVYHDRRRPSHIVLPVIPAER